MNIYIYISKTVLGLIYWVETGSEFFQWLDPDLVSDPQPCLSSCNKVIFIIIFFLYKFSIVSFKG